MYSREQEIGSIPEETIRVARAAYPKGNVHMRMRDTFGILFEKADFQKMYSRFGQPGIAAWRLMLVTIMQYTEDLSDRQAAEAVRGRIDWKYVLGLALDDAGFDFSVLSEFRSRLLESEAGQYLFELMLTAFKEHGLLNSGGRQRTDSRHVLAAVHGLNRLAVVGETLRAALNCLAVVCPQWLISQTETDWFERYGKRFEETRLPQRQTEREAMSHTIGRDGKQLLSAVEQAEMLPWLKQLPAIVILQLVWQQQYLEVDGQFRMRTAAELALAGERINSPYDPEARYAIKRGMEWNGYKAHLTETCDPGMVHIITHVETTTAEIQDITMTEVIQQALEDKAVCPNEHIVDAGYVDADLLVTSQTQHGIDLIGPTRSNSWLSRQTEGFQQSDFYIDWEKHCAICPMGKTRVTWQTTQKAGNQVIAIRFSRRDCRACSSRSACTTAKSDSRSLAVPPHEQFVALQNARLRQKTVEYRQVDDQRAGIEGTISEATRVYGLRRSRYIGLAKTQPTEYPARHHGTADRNNYGY
jgi:transposase